MESEMRIAALRIAVQKVLDQERKGNNPNTLLALSTIPCICCEVPSSSWLSHFKSNFMPDSENDVESSDDLQNGAKWYQADVDEEFRTHVQDPCCSKWVTERSEGCSSRTKTKFSTEVECKKSRKKTSSKYNGAFHHGAHVWNGSQQESSSCSDFVPETSRNNISDSPNVRLDPSITSRRYICFRSSSGGFKKIEYDLNEESVIFKGRKVGTSKNSSEEHQTNSCSEEKPTNNSEIKSSKASNAIPVFEELFHDWYQDSVGKGHKIRISTEVSVGAEKNVDIKIELSKDSKEGELVVDRKIPDLETLIFNLQQKSSCSEEFSSENSSREGTSLDSQMNVSSNKNTSKNFTNNVPVMDRKIPDFDTIIFNLQQKLSYSEEFSSENISREGTYLDSQMNASSNKNTSENFASNVPVKNAMIPLIENLLYLSEESSTDNELVVEKSGNVCLFLQRNTEMKTEQTEMIETVVPVKNTMIPLIEELLLQSKEESITDSESVKEKSKCTFLDNQIITRIKPKNSEKSPKHQSMNHDREDLVKTEVESPSCQHQKVNDSEELAGENEGLKRLLKLSLNLDSYEILPSPTKQPPVEKKRRIKWTNKDYKKARDQIYSKVAFHYKNCIIVWCPLLKDRCELVHTVIAKYGKIISAHDRWLPPVEEYGIDDEHNEECWGGVFVAYATEREAKCAAREIPKNYSSMKALELSKLFHCLVKSELHLFRLENQEVTDVYVNRPVSGDPESQEYLKPLLRTFGETAPEECYDVCGQKSLQHKIVYTCAAYAFLARTVLDGHLLGQDKGHLSVVVRETGKEKAILRDLLFRLQKYTGKAYFPFHGIP